MKFNRNELKSLIKECLVELLAEGLGNNLVESYSTRPRTSTQQKSVSQPQRRDPYLDTPVSRGTLPKRPQPSQHSLALQEAVKASAGGNPIMQDILADTAMTTLQQQINAEGRGPVGGADPASMMVANSNPEELFGEEAASKWADLAFATGPRRG